MAVARFSGPDAAAICFFFLLSAIFLFAQKLLRFFFIKVVTILNGKPSQVIHINSDKAPEAYAASRQNAALNVVSYCRFGYADDLRCLWARKLHVSSCVLMSRYLR
jgi:hypothetical protein